MTDWLLFTITGNWLLLWPLVQPRALYSLFRTSWDLVKYKSKTYDNENLVNCLNSNSSWIGSPLIQMKETTSFHSVGTRLIQGNINIANDIISERITDDLAI